MSGDVRVLVVDDQEPFRAIAGAVIDATDGFVSVGSAATGEAAVAAFTDADGVPDLVLMDVNLPGMDGFEATRRIRALVPEAHVVIISTYRARDYGDKAAEAGAEGFLDKADFSPDALESVWRRIRAASG